MRLRDRRLIEPFLALSLFLGLSFFSITIAHDKLLTGRDEHGRSALHVAVIGGNVGLVEYILNVHGADARFVNATDFYSRTAFDYIVLHENNHPVLYATLQNYFGFSDHY